MKQVMALLNDVTRPCASKCNTEIIPGEITIREFRKFGRDRYHHSRCWKENHARKEASRGN